MEVFRFFILDYFMNMLTISFFDRDPQVVAKALLGKVLRHYYQGIWLSALIIETEAYYLEDKASHASLGFTPKRKALFMPAGTIYMYYARGGDSLNVSCRGEGNAVLIKSGVPYGEDPLMLHCMQTLNPAKNGLMRPREKLCAGQTLLCKSLNLKVTEWDQQPFIAEKLRIDDEGICPKRIVQTPRLGIPKGRDEHLPYRFISGEHVNFCTSAPKRVTS
jgi:DNA-3-methyladenine glycosylase